MLGTGSLEKDSPDRLDLPEKALALFTVSGWRRSNRVKGNSGASLDCTLFWLGTGVPFQARIYKWLSKLSTRPKIAKRALFFKLFFLYLAPTCTPHHQRVSSSKASTPKFLI
jgi:hypothetical protein